MRAMQCHVLRWSSFQKEQRYPQHSSVLFVCAATHPLHAGVVGHMSLALHYLATLNLPTISDIFYVIETFAYQRVCKTHIELSFFIVVSAFRPAPPAQVRFALERVGDGAGQSHRTGDIRPTLGNRECPQTWSAYSLLPS